jgi:hypothetical protein
MSVINSAHPFTHKSVALVATVRPCFAAGLFLSLRSTDLVGVCAVRFGRRTKTHALYISSSSSGEAFTAERTLPVRAEAHAVHGSCHRTRRDASCSTTGYIMFLLPQRKGFETARSSLYLYPLSLCSTQRRGENESRFRAPHAKLFPLFISALGSRKQQKEWGRFFLLAAANAMHLIMWRARATTPANLITIERALWSSQRRVFCERIWVGIEFPREQWRRHISQSPHCLKKNGKIMISAPAGEIFMENMQSKIIVLYSKSSVESFVRIHFFCSSRRAHLALHRYVESAPCRNDGVSEFQHCAYWVFKRVFFEDFCSAGLENIREQWNLSITTHASLDNTAKIMTSVPAGEIFVWKVQFKIIVLIF